MNTDVDLTARERAVVNAFQGGFPVVERPFEPAAAAIRDTGVDIDATGLLETIRDLDDRGVLSRFGPLVNAQEIGGAATLVAMHAPEDRFDEIVEQVNDHREVAHNYEREHPHLNVWFVVSVADEDRVEEVLAEIEAKTGQRRTTCRNNASSASRPSSTSTARSTATGTSRRPGSTARTSVPT